MSVAPVCIRADAGPLIGLGHRSRCFAIAQALAELGIPSAWAGRADLSLDLLLGAAGNLVLPGIPDGEADEADGARTGRWARGARWLVVDHLGPDARWAAAVQAAAPGLRLVVIDDHQQRTWADLRLAPTQEPQPRTCAGPDWLPLDPGFAAAKDGCERSGVLLFFSRNDPGRLCRPVLEALQLGGCHLPVTVIADDAAAARDGLDPLLAGWPAPARRIDQADGRMAALVSSAAAVGCSASTIAWEALAAGTPVAALAWIDNQGESARALGERGVRIARDPAALARLIPGLVGSTPPLYAGDGARRVARLLADGLDCA